MLTSCLHYVLRRKSQEPQESDEWMQVWMNEAINEAMKALLNESMNE
jgi:hypothetical protein